MWGIGPYEHNLVYYDTESLTAEYSVEVTDLDTTLTITGFNGLSVDPISGDIYVIAKIDGQEGRSLGILDLGDATFEEIGNTGDRVASITFDSAGNLYAIIGDGGSSSETLFTVDLTTAELTSLVELGDGSDGESIAYCPDDGLIYHASGRDTNFALETIDPATSTITDVTYSEATDEVFGMTWDATNSVFVMATLDSEMVELDTAGTVTTIGEWSDTGAISGTSISRADYIKGLLLLD